MEKSNSGELTQRQKHSGEQSGAERGDVLSQHYAITLTQEMVHSQGISPSNLFIHFLQRGNLTHDLIHLCDVAGMPAAPRDTSCIFGPQINTQKSQNYWIAAEQTRGAAEGGRGGRGGGEGGYGGGGPQMLSLAISLSICSRILATLKTDTFYSHMTRA